GTRLELGNEPLERADDPFPQRRRLVREVASLIRRSGDLLAEHSPRSPVNRCGYQLNDVLTDTHLDLAKLLTGSAGTLALTTEATVGIEPDVRYRAVALLLFGSMENAARAVTEVVAFSPTACDLMDRRHVSLAREHDVRFDLLIPAETEAVLLVEFAGDDMDEVRDSLRRMIDRLWRRKKLAFGARHTIDPTEVELYWGLARHVVPTLYRLKGSSRPLPFVEDLAVPPAALPGFLTSMQNVFKKHQATFSLFGHAGHGQLHVRPFLDLASSADLRRMEQIAAELYEQVWLAGGTISGEHGDGFSRTQFIRRQYGPLYDSFRDLKQIFDPNNLLNPGKVIGGETDALTKHLRPVTFV
ncbi:MAG: FAD-linked oxidase C-terminal domain-containing protein, partial [Pirellulales bacterium]